MTFTCFNGSVAEGFENRGFGHWRQQNLNKTSVVILDAGKRESEIIAVEGCRTPHPVFV